MDEAEGGRITDRPEFRKMIDEASKPNAPFQEILVWKCSRFTRKREHAVAFKSMLRRKGVRVVSITEHAGRHPHRQADGGHHRERGRILLGESGPGGHEGDAGVRIQGLPGSPATPHSATTGSWCKDGPKKRPTLEPDEVASRIVKRIFEMAEAGNGMVNITSTLNDEGVASPRGKLWGKTSVHSILINEAYTGTLIWA